MSHQNLRSVKCVPHAWSDVQASAHSNPVFVMHAAGMPISCSLGVTLCLHSCVSVQAGVRCRDFKQAIQGAFFTDRQFNYQLTADEACKLCDMFSKSATKRLYQVSTVAQPVLDCNPSAISNAMHCVPFQCSVRPAQALTLLSCALRNLYLCLDMWNVGMNKQWQISV